MTRTVFIFGYGYTARYFSSALQACGFHVSGTTRSSRSDSDQNVRLHPFSLSSPIDFALLNEADAILVCIPPLENVGDLVLHYYGEHFKKLTRLKWLGYLSATSVYGDHQGNLVSEMSQTRPSFSSGRMRLEAEKAWQACAKESNLPLHIFRLSGIYGPSRSILDRLRTPHFQNLYAPEKLFSRIHVVDIVQTLLNSLNAPETFEIYNVTDDNPAPFHEVAEYAARLIGVNPPPRVTLDMATITTRMREFLSDSRRISNEKIKEKLSVNLVYPSYREGLMAICQGSSPTL